MRRLQHIFFGIVSLIIAAFTLTFILQNKNTVSVTLLIYETPAVPVAVIIMLSLIVGMIITMFLSSILLVNAKLRLSSTRRQLNNAKKELAKQNTIPVLKTK